MSETITIERVRTNAFWPPERSAELEILWKRGLSATQIAGVLGDGLTRNAVIGKIHRLGLNEPLFKRQPKSEKKAKEPREPRDRKRQGDHHAVYKIARGGNGGTRVIQSITSDEIAKLRSVDIVPLAISIMDLEPHHCRFPYDGIEGGLTTYCGHPSIPGRSWCVHHFHLCSWVGTASERRAGSFTEEAAWKAKRERAAFLIGVTA
jgi:GcrA cell cycle regulator